MTPNNSLIISNDDLSFMLNQTESEINVMIAGMLSIINENKELNDGLQAQSWCQRMFNTIIGKNKATAREIRQNHDKLNAYVVQAVGELYNRNKINSQIMVSLSLQITQLYNSHLELKRELCSIASKLNEKIESVDNYHILLQEIDENIYSDKPEIIQLLSIISQIDYRMISDDKKMRLLEQKLSNKNLLTKNNTLTIKDFIIEITNLFSHSLSVVYADLQLYQGESILADLAINAIESWNLLSDSNRKILKKQLIIDRIIDKAIVNEMTELSLTEIYDEFIALRKTVFDKLKTVLIKDGEFDDNKKNYKDEDKQNELYEGKDKFMKTIDIWEKKYQAVDKLQNITLKFQCEDKDKYDIIEEDIEKKIADYVVYYLGTESSYVTYTRYIDYNIRAKAKKNIVDKSDTMSGFVGAVIGGVLFGPLGLLGGAVLGNKAKNEQEFTCNIDDIVAIVDSSIFNNCKEGLVFTQNGIFFSQLGDVSIYIKYDDISYAYASGTTGSLEEKLEIERYSTSKFSWTDTSISKNKVARLLNKLKDIC